MDGGGMRLVVITRHQLFRDSLGALLGACGLRVVGEAASVDEACAVIQRLQPEAALFDIELPTPPNRETVATLQATAPRTRLVALGSMHDEALRRRLAARGISSYISKESHARELMRLLHGTAGQTGGSVGPAPADVPCDTLSQRERAVLELVASSMTNAQIARRLEISEATVKRHLHNIFRKLHAVSRMDAVNKGGIRITANAATVSVGRRPSPPAGSGGAPAGRF